MAGNRKRTIKISEEAYQALSHQSEKDKKPMEEIASAAIMFTLNAETGTTPGLLGEGEVYNSAGKRIFRGEG